jgi:hypothetical protein
MKVATLITSHSQTEEWEISAEFFQRMPKDSILKNSDVLVYANSKDVKASQIEKYLEAYPNSNKYLFYTPMNGHSVEDLPLDAKTNVYKTNYGNNRTGYLFGFLEACASTWDLLKSYDYVLQINTDVYVTDSEKFESYMKDNESNDAVFHVSTMRCDIDKGFACDTILYRPNLMKGNYFSLYRHPQLFNDLMQRQKSDPNYRFLPEQFLKHIILASGSKYVVMGPGTRNNRQIDAFGLWHCHDNAEARKYLSDKSKETQ